MISRCISTACLPYSRYINIRVGLFIVSMDYIYSIEIHQELLVKFSCNFYKILLIEFILVTLLVFVTSSYHNNFIEDTNLPILSSIVEYVIKSTYIFIILALLL